MKQTIYLGPTVPGVARENVIFKDKLPKQVEERAKGDKAFAHLLVPMEKAIDARSELKVKGSVMAVSYEKVCKSL